MSRRGVLTLPRRAVSSVLLAMLVFYKRRVSPFLPRACRFTPTCSEYARLAILEFGPWKGGWLAVQRIFRCHPLHPGGIDLPR